MRQVVRETLAGAVAVASVAVGGKAIFVSAAAITSRCVGSNRLVVTIPAQSAAAAAMAIRAALVLNLMPERDRTRIESLEGDEWSSMRVDYTASGLPVLVDALVRLECVIRNSASLGDQLIFDAELVALAGRSGIDGQPAAPSVLHLDAGRDAAICASLRDWVVRRGAPTTVQISVEDVARMLAIDGSSAERALIRLELEESVIRDRNGRYTVPPIDAALITASLHACALVLSGVVTAVTGKLTTRELLTVRGIADAIGAATTGPALNSQIFGFVHAVISLAGNRMVAKLPANLGLLRVVAFATKEQPDARLGIELSAIACALVEALAGDDPAPAVSAVELFSARFERAALAAASRSVAAGSS